MSEPQFVRRNIDGLLINVSQPKKEGSQMSLCRDCSSYRPCGDGLGTCHIFSTPFGGDSTPVCGSFTPQIPEEREATTIAGKFAEALDLLEDAACHLRDIDEQYKELYPDDECEEPELFFWQEVRETIDAGCFRKTPLQRIQEKLEAVADCVPKEVVKA